MDVRRTRCVWLALLLIAPLAPAAFAQVPADAYYDFLLGHRLDGEGDDAGALEAFRRAAEAAPASAHIQAEIAALHLRRNQAASAETAARAALALDPESTEAHRVLGLVLSSSPDRLKEAVTHLEHVMATPAGATDVSLQFTLGRLYLMTGSEAKAIDLLTRIVEEQPYLLQARMTLVQALTGAGRGEEAIDVLAPVAGSDVRLNSTLAQLLTRAGRLREASEALGRAATANPGNREAQMQYAASLLATGTRSDAERVLRVVGPLIERNGRDAGALYLQSQAFRRTGDVFGAERAARSMLAIDPASPPAVSALAQAYGYARRYQDVITTIESFAAGGSAHGPSLASLLTYLSSAYQATGQHDRAIDALKRAAAADPDDRAIDVYLVQAYLTARRFDDAAALAATARTAAPGNLRFTLLEARARFLGGQGPAAVTLLEGVLASHPDDAEIYLSLADLYGQVGRVGDALALLDRAESRFEGATMVAFRRGAVLAEADRHEEAEAVFRRVLEREPQNADALNYLGYMFAELGRNLDEAVALVTRALEVDEDNPSFLDSLGWVYFKKGDYQQADRYLSRASDALPMNSVVQDHYGDTLARLGREKEAALAWERALAGDGEEIDRQAIERKLKSTARGRK